MAESDIVRLLHNAKLIEISSEESIVVGIKVDTQLVKSLIDQQKQKSTVKCPVSLDNKYSINVH